MPLIPLSEKTALDSTLEMTGQEQVSGTVSCTHGWLTELGGS